MIEELLRTKFGLAGGGINSSCLVFYWSLQNNYHLKTGIPTNKSIRLSLTGERRYNRDGSIRYNTNMEIVR
jgi:hypothetical protein